MKIKCEYCGNYLSDTDEKCPSCMAPNEHLKRVGNEVPQTIEELKIWYQDHNLPPEEVTRFFIGKNIKEARAFGIYLDDKTGNYVVYKNKGSGERAVRYEGKDENYAVNELYLKLKEEIQNQKALNGNHNYPKSNGVPASNRFKSDKEGFEKMKKTIFGVAIFFLFMSFLPFLLLRIYHFVTYNDGYYESNHQLYYLYKDCFAITQKKCEWYTYNEKEDTWTQYLNRVKKPKYGGSTWDSSNTLYTKYSVLKQYYEEDWYKQLHPPTPNKGYYNYNNELYYYYYGWYILRNNQWEKASQPSGDIIYNPDNYYDSDKTINDSYDFEDTDYYSTRSSSYDHDSDNDSSWSSSSDDDSWDSGSSWDSSDSWDSGGSDWDSDW